MSQKKYRIINTTLEKHEPKENGSFYLSFMMVTIARCPKIKDTKLQ
jgi:hypothetical protein